MIKPILGHYVRKAFGDDAELVNDYMLMRSRQFIRKHGHKGWRAARLIAEARPRGGRP